MENKHIDARPALPTSENSHWDVAITKCDNVYSIIDSELKNQNITAWIRKSKIGEYPLYVAVDSWIQNGTTNIAVFLARSFLKVTILVDPCREHKFTYVIELKKNGKELTGEYWKITEDELRQLVIYLIKGGKKPKFFLPRVSLAERIIGTFIPFVGNPPKNKLIPEARPNYFTMLNILGWIGAVISVFAIINIVLEGFSLEQLWFLYIIAFAALVFAVVMSKKRDVVEVVPKQPPRIPRREYRIDSWHVSVPGAGEQFEQFKQRLYGAIESKEQSIEMDLELHQRFTPRGYEERERPHVFTS